MSFSREAKEEILDYSKFHGSSVRSFLSAVIHTAGAIDVTEKGITFELTSELKGLVVRVQKEFKKLYNAELILESVTKREIITGRLRGKRGADILCDLKILSKPIISAINFGIDGELYEDENKLKAYVVGAFLGCGYVKVPEGKQRGYHLEFSFTNNSMAEDFCCVLREKGFDPKIALRKDKYLVYFKDVESISDLLAYLGAMNSVIRLSEILVSRDTINRINRQTNCQLANIDKAVIAAGKQIQAIEDIEKNGGLMQLNDNLYMLAVKRREFGELNLEELGLQLEPKLTKSGVNHRMRKLLQYAKTLTGKDY